MVCARHERGRFWDSQQIQYSGAYKLVTTWLCLLGTCREGVQNIGPIQSTKQRCSVRNGAAETQLHVSRRALLQVHNATYSGRDMTTDWTVSWWKYLTRLVARTATNLTSLVGGASAYLVWNCHGWCATLRTTQAWQAFDLADTCVIWCTVGDLWGFCQGWIMVSRHFQLVVGLFWAIVREDWRWISSIQGAAPEASLEVVFSVFSGFTRIVTLTSNRLLAVSKESRWFCTCESTECDLVFCVFLCLSVLCPSLSLVVIHIFFRKL